jgi:ABC-type sugar transport system permease subunit
MIRILGAVMAGGAVTGVGLTLIGLLVLKPHGSGVGFYATLLLACAVNLAAAALIWRFIVRRPRPGASQ